MKSIAKLGVLLAVTLIVVVMPQVPAWGDTTFVSGTIHSNTTWTPIGNPYLVIGDTRVDTNIILTIQPGVQVKVNAGFSISVDGGLIARGTPSDSIVFDWSIQDQFWGSLGFNDPSLDSVCLLEYCRVTHANVGIGIQDASPRIMNCSIISNGVFYGSGHGISIGGPRSRPTIEGNLIYGNSSSRFYGGYGGGIIIWDDGTGSPCPVIKNNVIRRNRVDQIYWPGGGAGISVNDYNISGLLTVVGNTIDSNVADGDGYGGGIRISGRDGSQYLIACNSISQNTSAHASAIYFQSGNAFVTLSGNTITGNVSSGNAVLEASASLLSSGIINMNYNNIYGNSNLSQSVFEIETGSGTSVVNGGNNWWGTTNQSLIDLLIYDFWDDPSLREVDYTPFSTSFNYPPSESIIVISPNGGEQYVPDSSTTIQWNPFCFTDSVKIEYSANGGGSWTNVVPKTINVGFYSWKIPLVSSATCRVRVSDAADGIPSDISDSNFTIRPPYIPGDANGDVTVDISDVVYLIAYIFSGGAAPAPLLAGDANCDSVVDISDVVYLISYIFSGGSAPCA